MIESPEGTQKFIDTIFRSKQAVLVRQKTLVFLFGSKNGMTPYPGCVTSRAESLRRALFETSFRRDRGLRGPAKSVRGALVACPPAAATPATRIHLLGANQMPSLKGRVSGGLVYC